jgi:hypothetical protein
MPWSPTMPSAPTAPATLSNHLRRLGLVRAATDLNDLLAAPPRTAGLLGVPRRRDRGPLCLPCTRGAPARSRRSLTGVDSRQPAPAFVALSDSLLADLCRRAWAEADGVIGQLVHAAMGSRATVAAMSAGAVLATFFGCRSCLLPALISNP